jgi:hypothetical protein
MLEDRGVDGDEPALAQQLDEGLVAGDDEIDGGGPAATRRAWSVAWDR